MIGRSVQPATKLFITLFNAVEVGDCPKVEELVEALSRDVSATRASLVAAATAFVGRVEGSSSEHEWDVERSFELTCDLIDAIRSNSPASDVEDDAGLSSALATLAKNAKFQILPADLGVALDDFVDDHRGY